MLTEKAAMYSTLGISKEVFAFGTKIEEELKERFAKIDEIAEYNQLKVIHAMQASKVSESCLYGTTGYGYNDLGRDTLEQVYATCFGTEDALVRPQIACGTHALATALSGNLRPGDELLSPVGKPYDTLEEVIGIRPSVGSLAEYGVTYRQVDLKGRLFRLRRNQKCHQQKDKDGDDSEVERISDQTDAFCYPHR